ncbi:MULTISPECIES: hypothetical protein [unclassified Ensifer]|uniref:hypothetical protein n=1 Tax=unclassified Ensifer TaxID=2633371 RepID=UPI000813CB6E|nr:MULTISPECIES: hypothetical protein [unclassified Ensifer]OCO99792.1 hypothetical protein BC362_25140 [Ensifer sp. LC14]OCP06125.1 hypothetical protein BBX50_23950 [Ensifer sp. LC11]OCP07075.1 hypothetical protein BC374_24175 [Ensifer sp. LC13]OCP31471.1 hypothetical protein BC364_23480 [Ensifer sp. LC499]
MALNAATVFRDYEVDSVPASGSHKIKKSEVRAIHAGIDAVISAFLTNGGLIFASKATLDASLNYAANTMAWVLGDATVANNGIYRKVGASGTGSWTRVADLPFSFIIASDTGAGTANAIQATTSIPVSGSALIWMNVFEANTASPVTVSFNGGAALTIKTNTGNNVASGGLVAGMIVLGIVSGSTFRILNDQVSSAIVAAAEAAQAAAEDAAADAVALVGLAASAIQPEDVYLSLVNFAGAEDNAKFTAAIAAAAALSNGATIFVPRGTYSITQKAVPQNIKLVLDKGAVIQPSAATASLFDSQGGLSGISGGLLVNPSGLATNAIIVSKPADNLSCVIDDIYFSQFTRAVRLTSGDCLKVTNCTGVSNGTFVLFADDGRNSTISGNYAIGGNGVSLQKVTQGAEGAYIQNNGFLPASGTYCVQLGCGLEISILGNIFDQITTGPAIIIDGQTNAIHSIKVESNWIGRQSGAANADYGLYVVGNVRDVKSFNNTYVGWQEAGIYFNGLAGGTLLYCRSLDDTAQTHACATFSSPMRKHHD